jgi:Tfp pilus assembly protein FimV
VVAPVVVALVVVAGAVGSFGRSMPRLVIGDPGAPISSGEVVVVGPGDTLWSIAEEHFPPDARATAVEALEALNGPSVGLELGDVVALPDLG